MYNIEMLKHDLKLEGQAIKISLNSRDDTLSLKLKFNLSNPSVYKKEKSLKKNLLSDQLNVRE